MTGRDSIFFRKPRGLFDLPTTSNFDFLPSILHVMRMISLSFVTLVPDGVTDMGANPLLGRPLQNRSVSSVLMYLPLHIALKGLAMFVPSMLGLTDDLLKPFHHEKF